MERRKNCQNRESSGRKKRQTSKPGSECPSQGAHEGLHEVHVGLVQDDFNQASPSMSRDILAPELPSTAQGVLHGSFVPNSVQEHNRTSADSVYEARVMEVGTRGDRNRSAVVEVGGGSPALDKRVGMNVDDDAGGGPSTTQLEEASPVGTCDTLQQIQLMMRSLTPEQKAVLLSTSLQEELGGSKRTSTGLQRKTKRRGNSEDAGFNPSRGNKSQPRLKQKGPEEPFINVDSSDVRCDTPLNLMPEPAENARASIDELCQMMAEAQKQTLLQISGKGRLGSEQPEIEGGNMRRRKRKRHANKVEHRRRGASMTSGDSSQQNSGGTGTALSTGDLLDFQFGSDWPVVKDVPPVQINKFGYPTGAYWAHMKPYCFDRGQYHFPWHIDWRKQSNVLKAKFIHKLRTKYPGNWESKGVLRALGKSIREKRARLKARFLTYDNVKDVTCPRACGPESFWQIFHDTKDPAKMAKADPLTSKAQERKSTGKPTFSHRCGRHGYDGVRQIFVSDFSSDSRLCTAICFSTVFL